MNSEDLQPDEIFLFFGKPNPFLYGLEATRILIPFMLCLGAAQALLFHFAKGVSIIFLIKLVVSIVCMLFFLSLVVVIILALGVAFIVTNQNVFLQVSMFGRSARRISIPVDEIESIEVRCYGSRYGSVYLRRYRDLYAALPLRPIRLEKNRGFASAWFSLDFGWPPLAGFYGFTNYESFAKQIVNLRDAAQPVRSGDAGDLGS